MSFFEPIPPPERPKRRRREACEGPASGVIPGIVPLELLLAKTELALVALTHLEVYPTGYSVELIAAAAEDRPRLGRLMGRPGWDMDDDDLPGPNDGLRFGVELSDGTKVSADNPFPFSEEDSRGTAGLNHRGGGGGDRQWRQQYWGWPLPPPGPFTFAVEWRAAEIPLTTHQVDAQIILDPAHRAEALFDGGPAEFD